MCFPSMQHQLHRAQAPLRGRALPQPLAQLVLSLSYQVAACISTSRHVPAERHCSGSADVFAQQLLRQSGCKLLPYSRHGLKDASEHGH